MSTPVVVSMLLKPACSDPLKRDALRVALDALGLVERTEGRASVTMRVPPARFEELFGVRPTPVPARSPGRPPGASDRGAPAGYVCEREPLVPASLDELVASVGVEPPMTRF